MICPTCHGDGEVRFNLTSDPQTADYGRCGRCGGTGEIRPHQALGICWCGGAHSIVEAIDMNGGGEPA